MANAFGFLPFPVKRTLDRINEQQENSLKILFILVTFADGREKPEFIFLWTLTAAYTVSLFN